MKVQVGAVAESYSREKMGVAAQVTAAQLAVALGGGGLAALFIRRYAEANRRLALVAHPRHYRELIVRIGREALLALSAQVERDLPRRLGLSHAGARGKRRHSGPGSARPMDPRDAALANHFRVEFYGRLAELLEWDRTELQDFWRDLDLYTGVARARRPRKSPRGSRRRKKDRHLGPFADRCAFLLDSSLLEKARRAAAKLHLQLERIARAALKAGLQRAGIGRILRRTKPRRAPRTQIKRRTRRVGKKRVARRVSKKRRSSTRRRRRGGK